MATTLEQWALPRLQQLLPIDDESLKQVISYTDSLSKDAAAEHLKNLLGDDGKALEFISSFNLRRQNAPASTQPAPTNHDRQPRASTLAPAVASEVPRAGGGRGRGGKKRANIHSLPARQIEGQGNVSGGYVKRSDESNYVPRSNRHENERQKHQDVVADNMALQDSPADATQRPLVTDDASLTSQPITSKSQPSAAEPSVSDSLSPRKAGSSQSSRNVSPAPKTKVKISGGTNMHGASSTLSDLDSAIRSLEIQTNPNLSSATSEAENKKRKCSCMATRHPLLDIAPNCLNCGKVVCVKEGIGPCTFCDRPLLTADEISKVLRVLKDERGEERMKANNAAHKKADVSYGKARAFTGRDFLAQASTQSGRSTPLSSGPPTPTASDDEASEKAKQHRDKLLGFQAQNARRTQIRDEAADYDMPTSGTSMWASPAERAQQLKKQQKVLREMEWNAKPEYEKRRVVASIDLQGREVVRRMADVEKPDVSSADEAAQPQPEDDYQAPVVGDSSGGSFSNNPLAKGLIKPKVREEKGKGPAKEKQSIWRRVQNDDDDNEAWILDGGIYGGQTGNRVIGAEEHAFA